VSTSATDSDIGNAPQQHRWQQCQQTRTHAVLPMEPSATTKLRLLVAPANAFAALSLHAPEPGFSSATSHHPLSFEDYL
jgi:hypothetical protein